MPRLEDIRIQEYKYRHHDHQKPLPFIRHAHTNRNEPTRFFVSTEKHIGFREAIEMAIYIADKDGARTQDYKRLDYRKD
jgi:hypothetical protein